MRTLREVDVHDVRFLRLCRCRQLLRVETLASTSIAGKCPLFARVRDSTMWPSTMPRTASATGSSMSSPSTSTRRSQVCLGLGAARPAEGVLTLLMVVTAAAGSSPAASPISRCAIAKRVMESITSSTSSPSLRRSSATRCGFCCGATNERFVSGRQQRCSLQVLLHRVDLQ